MKIRLLYLLIFIMSAICTDAVAQRCIPGQISLQLTSGTVDGLLIRDNRSAYSYYADFSLNRYTKKRQRWEFGVTYLQKDYVYRKVILPKMQFTGSAGYSIPLLHSRSDVFILSCGVSALLGYETVNRGEKQLHDGAMLNNKDCFL